jgi:uncharacterized protein YheU (UPF0270 family)
LIVPPSQLSEEALQSVIEDWLSRQAQESAMDAEQFAGMVDAVRQQLLKSQLLLTWDDESQTVNIMHPDDLPSNC